jgi:hypothetical protein
MTEVAEAPSAPEQEAAGALMSEEQARQLASEWAKEQAARLTERVQRSLARSNGQANGGLAPRIGEPTTYEPGGRPYVAFDVVSTSPIQFIGLPPYQPSKIIKAGEFAFLEAFIFANPKVDVPAGWALPANVVLGGLPWRMTLDLENLTTGGAVGHLVASGTFGNPANIITPVYFLLPTPNPGADPWLIEANVTVYVDAPAKPFAAFATNFYDIDNDPGFPYIYPPIPPETAGWRYELPNRYLLYSN